MTQILMIAPTESARAVGHRHGRLAHMLTALGNEVSLLAPRSGARMRRGHEKPRSTTTGEISGHPVDLLPLGRLLPGVLDAALRRTLPAALKRAGLRRPDVVAVGAVDSSVVVARMLSVLYGMPYVVVLDEQAPVTARIDDRYEQLLAQSMQEATIVAATTPELAERLRMRFSLPGVELVAGDSSDALAASVETACARAAGRAGGRRMVFHAPYPLDPAPTSASRQRPNKMLAAFDENGHVVHRITGNPFQRALGYRDLRRRVAGGQQVEFAYSENSTQPNVLATSLKHGLAPFLEARILDYCRRRGIPFGQFYRDVYWRFAESQATAPLARRALMQIAYRADLAVLRSSHAHLFLPSLPMAPIVPFDEDRSSALPPGAPVHDSPTPVGLDLLYVGGIGAGYALDEGLRALQTVEQASLTMVVRRHEWETHRERYSPLLTDRVRVVHAGSEELQELYDGASACLLLVAPDGYRRFAVPLKLYEYLGYGKPTLASQGTLAGELVEEMGSGFTVPNAHEEIAALLQRLAEEPSMLEHAAERARAARLENTWAMRARTVAEVLTGNRGA
jgi:glycosyltransferase involved in cell wall biosynthesis